MDDEVKSAFLLHVELEQQFNWGEKRYEIQIYMARFKYKNTAGNREWAFCSL